METAQSDELKPRTGEQTVCVTFAEGCSRSMVDVALVADFFELNGWDVVDALEDADVVVVFGCAFDAGAETVSTDLIQAADRRRRPDSRLIISGCAAHVCGEPLAAATGAELIPPQQLARYDDLTDGDHAIADVPDPSDVASAVDRASRAFSERDRHPRDGFVAMTGRRLVRALGLGTDYGYLQPTEGYLTVRAAWGCVGACAYCSIRGAHGALASKPVDEVVREVVGGLERGYTEFKVVAQDLGSWGQDIDSDITVLLEALLTQPGEYRLTLVDFNVRWLVRYTDRIIDLLTQHAEKVRHVALPLQSGSDDVLERMRRGYGSAEARGALIRLRGALPHAALATHVMIGFPGETEEDIDATIELLRAVGFDRVDVYDYSDRPGVASTDMADKVPQRTIRKRSGRVRDEFEGRRSGFLYRARSLLAR